MLILKAYEKLQFKTERVEISLIGSLKTTKSVVYV